MSINIPVGLWLESQAGVAFDVVPPVWAQQLAQAHALGSIQVLAHAETAYARADLACVKHSSVVADDAFWADLSQVLDVARARHAQKIIVMMPSTAEGVSWAKNLLVNLESVAAQLDEVLAMVSLAGDWGGEYNDPLEGAMTDKLLMSDRVLSFGEPHLKTDFVRHMQRVNPMAQWLDEQFTVACRVEQPCRAYVAAAPLWLEALKNDNLYASPVQEVVYFTFSKPILGERLKIVLDRWRSQYGLNLMRLQAVVFLKGAPSPLCIQAIQDLWTDDFVGFWQADDVPKTEFWLCGNHLPWAEMETEIAHCMAA